MRTNGVSEAFLHAKCHATGEIRRMGAHRPFTLRNPLYHWTHLELKHVFGIGTLLPPDTTADIWDTVNEQKYVGQPGVDPV